MSTCFAQKDQADPLHWSGDRTLLNRKENVVELFGNAKIHQKGETLNAEYIKLNLDTRDVLAKGNCDYLTPSLTVHAEKINFNLKSRTGTLFSSKITDGNFLLTGEEIFLEGNKKYRALKGEYTTCRDCPSSWSFEGEEVSLELGGYAYMKDVSVNIKGTPIFWFPYLIIPMKSARQTGVLFPDFGVIQNSGFTFLLPFFWAMSRSTDMTIWGGNYSKRGYRFQWEGRYTLDDYSSGQANFFFQKDSLFESEFAEKNRWAFNIKQQQELFWGIKQKFRSIEVSDLFYPTRDFKGDVPGAYQPALSTELIFSRTTSDLSYYLSLHRYRSLLNFDEPLDFDHRLVQLLPRFELATRDFFVGESPVAFALKFNLSRFVRGGDIFDYHPDSTVGDPYVSGVDPIRQASRLSITPTLYSSYRLFDVLTFEPSVKYKSYYYNFSNQLPNLARGYLQVQTDFSFQLERIYQTGNPQAPRVKHLIRPTISYSRIPFSEDSNPTHGFLQQIETSGFNFDNEDIIPMGRSPSVINYFTPKGNSLSYGFVTQLIERQGRDEAAFARYNTLVDFSMGQSIDFLEFHKDESQRAPLSRIYSLLRLNFGKLSFRSDYYFYPNLSRLLEATEDRPDLVSPHVITSSLKYIIEKGVRQKILQFERSVSLSYSFNRINSQTNALTSKFIFSINDFFMPSVSFSYDFERAKMEGDSGFTNKRLDLNFQAPSQCWKLALALGSNYQTGDYFLFEFNFNFTGQGYGTFEDLYGKIANQ